MAIPAGFSTINPFIITHDVSRYMTCLTEVFDAVEHPDARSVDSDGLLIHAELQIGDSTIMFGDRKPGWPYEPSLLQVYVDDVDATLARAVERGATIITKPTDFFGEIFTRHIDPWGNGWWVWSTPTGEGEWGGEGGESGWDAEAGASDAAWDAEGHGDADWEPTADMLYIRDSLFDFMRQLRDPLAK